jgi:hypothetical protein
MTQYEHLVAVPMKLRAYRNSSAHSIKIKNFEASTNQRLQIVSLDALSRWEREVVVLSYY